MGKHSKSLLLIPALLWAAGCSKPNGCAGDTCGTVVFAAPGEAHTLLPVMSNDANDRDIFDQLFLKLADIGTLGNTLGDSEFEPQLASSWTFPSPVSITFHLDPRAKWQDGQRVTATDVAFTFTAYHDSLIDSPYRKDLNHIVSVVVNDSATVTYTFDKHYPEMFFDAVYTMRILPSHLLQSLKPAEWKAAPFGRQPVGDGPYRFVAWTPGQSIELAADSTFFLGRPHIRRLIWRFTTDLTVAVTQVVAGEADAIQVLVTPPNIEKATKSGHLALDPYPGSTYTLLRFNTHANGNKTKPHPVLSDSNVRRALVMATDRVKMAQSVFGEHAKVPPGPISEAWTGLWFSDLPVPAFDTAAAGQLLEAGGWHRGADGVRARNGVKLSFHIAVPGTSSTRKQYAQLIQEQLKAIGADVVIDVMEGATMRAKQAAGAFDTAIESWNTDPSPGSMLASAWSKGGGTNTGGYVNAAFDKQVEAATSAADAEQAKHAWHAALGILANDPPAIMLYALDNVAAVDNRITDVKLRPDYWWAYVRTWRIAPDKLTDRDRAEH